MAYHERCSKFLEENWRNRGDQNLPIKAWHDGFDTAKSEGHEKLNLAIAALEKIGGNASAYTEENCYDFHKRTANEALSLITHQRKGGNK